jgi:hypothetical protein
LEGCTQRPAYVAWVVDDAESARQARHLWPDRRRWCPLDGASSIPTRVVAVVVTDGDGAETLLTAHRVRLECAVGPRRAEARLTA